MHCFFYVFVPLDELYITSYFHPFIYIFVLLEVKYVF